MEDEQKEKSVETKEAGEIDANTPRVAAVASRGITDSEDIKRLMCALIPDIIDGRVNVAVANATVQASRQLINMVELEMKYGSGDIPRLRKPRRPNALALVSGDDDA